MEFFAYFGFWKEIVWVGLVTIVIMRPSSLAGGRIMRRTLPVCPSIPLTLPPDTV